jgi:MYXO-CTERM domain-containing protein
MTIPSDRFLQDGGPRIAMARTMPALALTLEVRAVDRNGNRSEPVTIDVVEDFSDDDAGGCAATGHGTIAFGLVWLVAAGLRRRRR